MAYTTVCIRALGEILNRHFRAMGLETKVDCD
jgi:hypothetical protein